MYWFLYLLGIKLTLSEIPVLQCAGFACLLLALYVHIRVFNSSDPVTGRSMDYC